VAQRLHDRPGPERGVLRGGDVDGLAGGLVADTDVRDPVQACAPLVTGGVQPPVEP
jgi:hypothetical protein